MEKLIGILKKRIQGSTDIELNKNGLAQGKELGIALQDKHLHIERIYTSKQKRAEKMALRTIMIFPQFENISVIDAIRNKYDPLAELVRPHITLVFPFECEMSNTELTQLLEKRLCGIHPFEIVLHGFSKQEDKIGNYLFLNVTQGIDEICNIHNILYEHELKTFDLGYGYTPHMTVGNLSSSQLLNEAFKDICLNRERFSTIVDKISVEIIGENDESIIIIEKCLK